MKYVAGVDVGGTNIVCGLLEQSGRLVAKRKVRTNPERGPTAILEEIADVIRSLCAEIGISLDEVVAVGMGIPGLIDPENGVCIKSVNLAWEKVSVSTILSEMLNKPVYIDNDVRQYVYGEAIVGAGKGHQLVYGLTIGTGLAAAFVNNGELYMGNQSLAGEIGHVAIDGFDFQCKCELIGCLETVVSATGIVRQAKQKLSTGKSSVLTEWYPDGDFTSADVSKAALKGDELALEVMRATGTALGMSLAWVVSILSPEVIVIGGGGSAAGDLILEPMHHEMKRRLLKDYFGKFSVKLAELGDDAGLIGSAMYALKRSSSKTSS